MTNRPSPDTSDDTLSGSGGIGFESAALIPSLTIIWHPDRKRIGARATILWDQSGRFEVSRWTPLFAHPDPPGLALNDRCISRQPLLLKRLPSGGIVIHGPDSSMQVRIDSRKVTSDFTVTRESLAAGLVICLGRRVVVCLHQAQAQLQPGFDDLGLIGGGRRMDQVRRQIRMAARSNASVLIQGETGTGKELAAQAIHQQSDRRENRLVSVNMATLGRELAAAELFGVRQGAFTGARVSRSGLFGEADGSTLFLDEIGDAGRSIQVMLLRVLEDGKIRAVGASSDEQVDVRVLAATDQDLESSIEQPFNQPLRRRLEALSIRLPALRERREDFGQLFDHFLRPLEAELDRSVEVPGELIGELAARDWPGNVRELKNVVRRLALNAGPDGKIRWDEDLARSVSGSPDSGDAAPVRIRYRDPVTVSDSELITALNQSGWRVMPSAKALGVSRTSMYALLKRCPIVRTADQIPPEEIEEVMQQASDLDSWAASLKTPREALKRRIKDLGIS